MSPGEISGRIIATGVAVAAIGAALASGSGHWLTWGGLVAWAFWAGAG